MFEALTSKHLETVRQEGPLMHAAACSSVRIFDEGFKYLSRRNHQPRKQQRMTLKHTRANLTLQFRVGDTSFFLVVLNQIVTYTVPTENVTYR